MHATLVSDALRRAIASGLITANAIFHSDRGSQYSANTTRSLLALCGLRQSMSAAGLCYDNAFAESAFASIKSELSRDALLFESHAAAKGALFDYLQSFYNINRRHGSLGFIKNHSHNLNPSLN